MSIAYADARLSRTPINSMPGAVVSLMERSNVETVIVARDGLFRRANIPQNLFRPN